MDFIISTDTCIYDTLEGFQRRGPEKKYNIIIFDQLILIYRANIGKMVILCQNIGIIGHFQKDRDFIGNIGPLEGLIFLIYNIYLSNISLYTSGLVLFNGTTKEQFTNH